MPKTLADRSHVLEDSFFKAQEAKHITTLRQELAAKKNIEALREVSGIDDNSVLQALAKLEVGAHDLSALALIPLVHVAWATGSVSDEERQAVLKAADAQGVNASSHTHALLEAWLKTEPAPELFDAWSAYVDTLRAHLDADEINILKESIVGLAHDVADATGGFLGIGSISKPEKLALLAISEAFDQ